jgi:hypothetical protein
MNPAKEILDAAAGNVNDPTCITSETVVVCFTYLSITIKSLKAVALELRLSGTGTKQVLFNHIRDSGHVNFAIFENNEFAQHCVINSAGSRIEAWIVLTLTALLLVPGVNMETGAQDGFCGQTSKDNTGGGTQSNFLTKEKMA